jgi:hypothetical protein
MFRNVCIDGGYLGQTEPDTLNARLSQFEPQRTLRFGSGLVQEFHTFS